MAFNALDQISSFITLWIKCIKITFTVRFLTLITLQVPRQVLWLLANYCIKKA